VFADPDGGFTVVDWKTGAEPADAESRRQVAVQLGVYRLAWAALQGCGVERCARHSTTCAVAGRWRPTNYPAPNS
jgi:RecB family exonuclease